MSLQLSVSEEDLKDKYANKLEPHMVGAEHEVGGEGGGFWWFWGVMVVFGSFGGFEGFRWFLGEFWWFWGWGDWLIGKGNLRIGVAEFGAWGTGGKVKGRGGR